MLSPLASDKYYNTPWIKQVMDLFGTIPISEITSWDNTDEVKQSFEKVTEALSHNRNILLYPSWQIYKQWFESIVWKQSVYNIVKLMPDNTKVLWIQDRWLWGSSFSMAWDNGKSGLFYLLFRGIWVILANFIFFVPKRHVTLDIHDITTEINVQKNKTLNEFNLYLENFYNIIQDTNNTPTFYKEKITYVPYYFYKDTVKNRPTPKLITGSLEDLGTITHHDISKIDIEIQENIITKISIIKEINSSSITPTSNLILDLYFDSLDLAEIKSYIQSYFTSASNPPINDLKSVWDLCIMAVWLSKNVEALKPCKWTPSDSNQKLYSKIS